MLLTQQSRHERKELKRRSIYKLFPTHPRTLVDQLKYDDEALISLTHQGIANLICEELLKYDGMSRDSTITDGTASVGGNVFAFARYFAQVHAVELDTTRHDMLVTNLSVLGIQSKVVTHHRNYLDIYDTLTQDAVFLDPPWGGLSYKQQGALRLYLTRARPDTSADAADRVGVIDLCERIFERCGDTRYIVLKLPKNYDMTELSERPREFEVMRRYNVARPNSMVLLFLKKKSR